MATCSESFVPAQWKDLGTHWSNVPGYGPESCYTNILPESGRKGAFQESYDCEVDEH